MTVRTGTEICFGENESHENSDIDGKLLHCFGPSRKVLCTFGDLLHRISHVCQDVWELGYKFVYAPT